MSSGATAHLVGSTSETDAIESPGATFAGGTPCSMGDA